MKYSCHADRSVGASRRVYISPRMRPLHPVESASKHSAPHAPPTENAERPGSMKPNCISGTNKSYVRVLDELAF